MIETSIKPDENYILSVGPRIKRGRDVKAKALLTELVNAWARCDGSNFKFESYLKAERRLRKHLEACSGR